MKLDRLKEFAAQEWAASPRFDSELSDWIVHGRNRNRQPKIAMGRKEDMEMIAEALNALPGLLRVCDAYQELLVSYAELDASRFGMTIDGSVVRWKAIRKLEEMLG